MMRSLLILIPLIFSTYAPNAFGGLCSKAHLESKDSTSEFLDQIKVQHEIYKKDLFGANELDPHFLNNFGKKKTGQYAMSEVIQHYPLPQAKESVENVLSRLKYVRDHWNDFKITSAQAEHFNIQVINELIANGEKILQNKKWSFYETMDFIDAGLMYGAGLRSSKEADGPSVEEAYVKARQVDVRVQGKSDPSMMYMFSKETPDVAFEYWPHPALMQPFLVQNRLFEIREFNWAMTKGAFLISVAPHKDIKAHDTLLSYWSFYHDVHGHFRGTAIGRTLSFVEGVYYKKGLGKIDELNGNKNEAKKLLEAYIKMRESFLTDLLTKGEERLSPEDQVVFHEVVFTYLHENDGAHIRPIKMHHMFVNFREKNPVNDFIIDTLAKYIESHDLEAFRY